MALWRPIQLFALEYRCQLVVIVLTSAHRCQSHLSAWRLDARLAFMPVVSSFDVCLTTLSYTIYFAIEKTSSQSYIDAGLECFHVVPLDLSTRFDVCCMLLGLMQWSCATLCLWMWEMHSRFGDGIGWFEIPWFEIPWFYRRLFYVSWFCLSWFYLPHVGNGFSNEWWSGIFMLNFPIDFYYEASINK